MKKAAKAKKPQTSVSVKKSSAKKPARSAGASQLPERRSGLDRRKGVIDKIYQRLVIRGILPERRKGSRRHFR